MTEPLIRVKQNQNSREALIECKNQIKSQKPEVDREDIDYLISLLSLPDPKSRKNVAQILGMLKSEAAVEPLYAALEKEDTEYVKSAYLLALKDINIDQIRSRLSELRNVLKNQKITAENRKHYDEQMSAYNDLLGSSVGKHTFCGNEVTSEVILTTPKGLGQVTADAMITTSKRVLTIGVCARISNLAEIKNIRTYKELLFLVPNMKKLSSDPVNAAEKVAEGDLKAFLCARHREKTPWGYRLHVVSSMDEKKKSAFIKRFAGELYRASNGYFVNQASDYEMEIRLLENKEGTFTTMIKLYTIKDARFDYRKEVIASSIRPELAANLIYLSADYLKSSVQVLDPFCGVGTMLMERYLYRKATPMYGVDCYGEAIEKAKKNATIAEIEAYFINRDYFDFKHDYQFDEIITNMPFSLNPDDKDKIADIYRKFFEYSRKLLKRGAVVIIYARDIESARTYSRKYGYIEQKEVLISPKENSYLCIYRKK
ncbi:MAG: methyltransferase domain-containing protein [Lachnospiraceae bacterium]